MLMSDFYNWIQNVTLVAINPNEKTVYILSCVISIPNQYAAMQSYRSILRLRLKRLAIKIEFA